MSFRFHTIFASFKACRISLSQSLVVLLEPQSVLLHAITPQNGLLVLTSQNFLLNVLTATCLRINSIRSRANLGTTMTE